MERDDERQYPGTDRPRRTAAMSDEDPERTRLGVHLEGASDTTADTTADATADAAEDAVDPGDHATFADEPDRAGAARWSGEPGGTVPGTYTGEEADATGRPQDAERPEPPVDRLRYRDEPTRVDRPGGGGTPLFADDEEADDSQRPRSPGER